MKRTLNFIDLFSGIGGFRIPLEEQNFNCLGFSEINKQAINTYKNNFDTANETNFGNIAKITDLPKADLITGGVPCQPWSVAGSRGGFQDARGKLWFDTIRLINNARPKCFILENVKGLTNKNNKDSLLHILNSFKGYKVYHKVLNALDFGLKQNRQRLFIVGFDKEIDFKFPEPTKIAKRSEFYIFCDTRHSKNTIHSWDLIETTARQKEICMLILQNRRKKRYGDKDGSPLSFANLTELLPNLKISELKDLLDKQILKKVDNKFEFVNSNSLMGINKIHRIYNLNSPSFSTVVSHGTNDFISKVPFKGNFLENIFYPKNFRKFSVSEISDLQGFPKDFKHHISEKEALKQIGNAVPVNVIRSLVDNIMPLL